MTDPFRDDPPRPIYRQRRHIAFSIVMVLFGLILLLPGACALFFMAGGMPGDGALLLLWLASFAISAGGVVLIVKAFR